MNSQVLKIFTTLVQAGDITEALGLMPNVPTPTMGGEFFWNTLSEKNGWRIQQNTITQHCRILDQGNVRRAWGSASAIEDLLRRYEM